MSLYTVLGISGSAMSAQSVRLNTVASNLANANDVASSAQKAYHARQPLFEATLQAAQSGNSDPSAIGVRVTGIQQSAKPVRMEYKPGNPLANKNGYVYTSDVNTVAQMANMISASQSYQSDVNVMTTTKHLLLNALQLANK